VAYSSIVTLTGNVNFTDSITGIHSVKHYSSGTAVFLRTTHPEVKSLLNITTGTTVYFVNLTSTNYGGAVYGENAVIYIGEKARVIFMNNSAYFGGGAVAMSGGMITVGAESCVIFTYNHACDRIWWSNLAL
jgi:predicted outer membrane repeat protein